MPNLIPVATIEIPTYRPRAAGRTAARNRRAMLKAALWPIAKMIVTLGAIVVKEMFL